MLNSDPAEWDVAVIGGALSGSATAIQLRQRAPDLRVLLVERDAKFGRRVGESTVEVSSYFLGRVLGLTDYLNQHHLVKQGLRFWFAGGDSHCPGLCSEIGPKYNVGMPAYQVDRAELDEELLDRARRMGVEVWRPAAVRMAGLNPGGMQELEIEHAGAVVKVRARWVVDASGTARFLARKNRWNRPNDLHPIGSIWSRWKGVRCLDEPELENQYPGFGKRCFGVRHTATNHLVGEGWWSWWIPLKGGDTSVGVVYDPRVCALPANGDPISRLRQLLDRHPLAAILLENASHDPDDVHARENLGYSSEVMAGDGFGLVGDAAAFLDPFYSPGMDWIAFSTASLTALILKERRGEMAPGDAAALDRAMRLSFQRWFEAIYRDKYFYLGDFDLMALAFQLDLGLYYLGVVSGPVLHGREALDEPPFSGRGTLLPFLLIRHYNRRLAAIARSRTARGAWGRHNTGRFLPFLSYRFTSELPRRILAALARYALLELTEGWRSWGLLAAPHVRNPADSPSPRPTPATRHS